MNNLSYEKTLNLALKIISRRPRSVAMLREKLVEKSGADSQIIEQVINRLIDLGYLNDGNFAYQYAVSKLNVRAMGRGRLQQTLVQKQVPKEIAKEALSQVFTEQDETQLCDNALAKYLRLHGRPRDQKESKKLFGYLIRLGFPYSLVIEKVRSISQKDVSLELIIE
jgi:regulatory protein